MRIACLKALHHISQVHEWTLSDEKCCKDEDSTSQNGCVGKPNQDEKIMRDMDGFRQVARACKSDHGGQKHEMSQRLAVTFERWLPAQGSQVAWRVVANCQWSSDRKHRYHHDDVDEDEQGRAFDPDPMNDPNSCRWPSPSYAMIAELSDVHVEPNCDHAATTNGLARSPQATSLTGCSASLKMFDFLCSSQTTRQCMHDYLTSEINPFLTTESEKWCNPNAR